MKNFSLSVPFKLFSLVVLLLLGARISAHQASAEYVANEAVLITHGNNKVLFDPFFHQAFGTYQLVSEKTKKAIYDGIAPFDNLTAVVISHAHDDHFAADEVLKYLQMYPATKLIGPKQAIDELNQLEGAEKVASQLVSVKLDFNEVPKKLDMGNLFVEAVRIPHAGWPGRAEVENIVFRITLMDKGNGSVTIMHMGDADVNDDHYLPYKNYWQSRQTDTAFPPYWFYFSAEGNDILDEIINAKRSVGIHVPVNIPKQLKTSGKDYFSKPGERRPVGEKHQH